MAIGEIETKRWTTDEYHRLGELGLLDEGRSELIEGEIYMMSPQGPRHAVALELISDTLKQAFGKSYSVRVQAPLLLNSKSAPEPDIAVVAGAAREHASGHPTTALLIVEVSDTSLTYDRVTKKTLYAAAGIAEFWILNLVTDELEVRRTPMPTGYEDLKVLQASDFVSPLALPGVQLAVNSFLP